MYPDYNSKVYYQQFQGFTIIELIVSISIIVILSTIAFVSFRGNTDYAKHKKNESNINEIGVSLEMHSLEKKEYPPLLYRPE